MHDDDPLPSMLLERELPVVLRRPPREHARRAGGAGRNFVDVDNMGGAREATEHLIGIGRRHGRDDRRPP